MVGTGSGVAERDGASLFLNVHISRLGLDFIRTPNIDANTANAFYRWDAFAPMNGT